MAQRPVVPAAVVVVVIVVVIVVAVAVAVGMMVVVSEEMRSVCADLSRGAVKSQAWAGIA